MSKDNLWISQRPDGKWALQREGGQKATGIFDTQAEAQQRAIEMAKKAGAGEVIVKGRNNKIRSKDSYGNDPRNIKDTEH